MQQPHLISLENAARLPANIKLISTPDFSDQLLLTDQLTRQAPCNVVVNNFYAESPRHAALRDFMREWGEMNAWQGQLYEPLDSIHDFREAPRKHFSRIAQDGRADARDRLAEMTGVYHDIADGIEKFGLLYPFAMRLRTERDEYLPDFHFDDGGHFPLENAALSKRFMLGADHVRALMPAYGSGTLIADTTNPLVAETIEAKDIVRNGQASVLKNFSVRKKPSVYDPPDGELWMTMPLSITIITKQPWPHTPCLHGSPFTTDTPEARGRRELHVIDIITPKP